MEYFLILVMIVAGTHAFFPVADTKCNATQVTSPCSVVLGRSVFIQVMTNASGHQLRCKKELSTGPINMFNVRKERVTIQEEFKNRTEFFISNGTLKITNVEKSDSSRYTVNFFDPNGVNVGNMSFTLDIKENISPILIPVSVAVGAVLILMCCCCCVCIAVKRRRKSAASI